MITLDGTLGITTPSETNTGTLSVTGVTTLTGGLNAALPVLSGGTGVTTSTGTGAVVLGTSPTITGATITVAATAAPAFSAYMSSSPVWTNGVATKAPINTEEFDTANAFDSTTNYRFTPLVAGYYQINGCISFGNAVATGACVTSLYKNGTEFKRGNYISINLANFTQAVVSSLIYLNGSTDYVELYGTQVSGGALTQNGGSAATYFQAVMVRSA